MSPEVFCAILLVGLLIPMLLQALVYIRALKKIANKEPFIKNVLVCTGTFCVVGSLLNTGLQSSVENYDLQQTNAAYHAALSKRDADAEFGRDIKAQQYTEYYESTLLYRDVRLAYISEQGLSCSGAMENIDHFMDFIFHIESGYEEGGDPNVRFAWSSSDALSFGQILPFRVVKTQKGSKREFDDWSMDTGLKRLKKMTERYGIAYPSWADRKVLKKYPLKFVTVHEDGQRAFFFTNFIGEKDNEELVNSVACNNDAYAAGYLYAYKHHRIPENEPAAWRNLKRALPEYYKNQHVQTPIPRSYHKGS